MIPVPITLIAYARGLGGAPSTSSSLIAPPIESYTHTISATGGFESCAVSFGGRLEDVFYWLSNGLMASVQCYAPDGMLIWEGFISTVSAKIGAEQIDLSIEDMANAVAVRYQPGVGAQTTTAFVTTADSIATYGRKELVYGGSGMTPTAATTLQSTLLAQRAYPVARRSSTVGTSEQADDVRITLTCSGWYYTLGWLTTTNTTTAVLGTTTQVGALLVTAAATNAFISTSTASIQGSALSDTQFIEANTPIRTKIERLLSLGNSSGQRIAYGVYEDREFWAKTWAGATPTAIGYQRYLGDDQLYVPGGGAVDAWNVRPDAMYQVIDLIDASTLVAGPDNIAAYYIERVTCTVDGGGQSVRLEPGRSSELDVLLARIRN